MATRNFRLIARLDVKNSNLIKGVNLEGLRIVGNPRESALKYYREGIDEIIYIDCVASLYGRNSLLQLVKETTQDVFVPITVGGGIRTLEDAQNALRSGADKISINTAAVRNPELLTKISKEFGRQALVASIEARKINEKNWEVLVENGRERTGLDVEDWARECEHLGAGELLLTSVDNEGTFRGFDIELVKSVASKVKIPVIASGGMGRVTDINHLVVETGVHAVAIAGVLHYGRVNIQSIRDHLMHSGINVRPNV